jgi:type I restriction enzyme M protein
MSADQYRDYILGFIFFKYLSEKQYIYANDLLEGEEETDYRKVTNPKILKAIYDESIIKLGYWLKPEELFPTLVEKGNINLVNEEEDIIEESNYILEGLQEILNSIEQSTMGQ